MAKYKNLIILLVVFGAIHLISTNAIIPALSKWMLNKGFETKTYMHQLFYMAAFLEYAVVIIWIPVSIWIYRDSKKYMFTPWLWALLILIAHYHGLIIYLLIKLLTEKSHRRK